MKLYPTTPAVHLSLAGATFAIVGLATGEPAILGFGIAVLVGLGIARAATLVSVARIRAAGFEMVWRKPQGKETVRRGESIVVHAEVRNRDTLSARYVGLRALASPLLEVSIDPPEGEVPANGKLDVEVKITTPRVGRHGLFGLALEVRGAPGLFEVPLNFASPFGIEVLPHAVSGTRPHARGGRSLVRADGGRSGRVAGEGSDLREVREYRQGDPWKRIAWKASAKRNKLLVREMEHDERDIVWIVVDASVELWAGPLGKSPLDVAIDEAARLAVRHGRAGDEVGFAMVSQRLLAKLPPARGDAQTELILKTLAHAAGTHDADRSSDAEEDVAYAVYEHLRPFDPQGLEGVRISDLDRLARRAEMQLPRAPFREVSVQGVSGRDRSLRGYRAAFGMVGPARLEPERPATLLTLDELLGELARGSKRPSVVHVLGQVPDRDHGLHKTLGRLRARRIHVRWSLPALSLGIEASPVVTRWLDLRVKAAEARAKRSLRESGAEPLAHGTRP